LSLSVLDECLIRTGQPEAATHFPQVLELYGSLHDHVQVARTLNNLAIASFFKSQWDSAAAQLDKAIDAYLMAGDIANAAFGQFNLGDIRLNQGRWDEAQTILSSARRTLEACDYRLAADCATMALGRTKVFLGDTDAGLALLRSASSGLDKGDYPVQRLECRARLAEALIFAGQLTEAGPVLKEARNLERSSPDATLSSLLDRIEVSLDYLTGNIEGAISRSPSYLDKARRFGAEYEVLMLTALGEEFGIRGDQQESLRLREQLGVQQLPLVDRRIDLVMEEDVNEPVPSLLYVRQR
jgi:tetratricopeptide (TPR) repeat protein